MMRISVLLSIISACSYVTSKTMGPVGTLTINALMECEDKPSRDDMVFTAELKTVDGIKSGNAEFTLKTTFDNTITYKADIKKWEISGWKPQLTREGNFCEDSQKFGPKLWEKLSEVIGGDFPTSCPIPPGSYTFNKYQAISKDFNVPTIYYGEIRAEIKLFKDNELISCLMMDINSQAPIS